MVQEMEVGAGETRVTNAKGHTLARINLQRRGEGRIGVFVGPHTIGRMQIEGHAQPLIMEPGKKGRRVGKQVAVPGVARPTPGRVPVHINHQHIEGEVVGGKGGDQIAQLALTVGIVA